MSNKPAEKSHPGSAVIEEVKEIASFPSRFTLWLIEELRFIFRVIISSCDRFYWDNGFSRAASLAYTTLLSLVPITALGFGIFASFAVTNENMPQIRKFIIKQFVPDIKTVDQWMVQFSGFVDSISTLNTVVVFFLVVTSILLLNAIEYALNEVWQVYEPRSIPHRIQIFCAIILMFPVLAISGAYFVNLRLEPYLSSLPTDSVYHLAYEYLLPYFIDFIAFVCLYYLVPKAPVKIRSAIFGAFLAAILFGVAKGAFAVYIEQFSSYGRIYGTVAGIPVFLFWLYLAWTIVLFGAESSYQAQYLPRSGKLWKRTMMSMGDGQMTLAMQSLIMIARRFIDGQKLPSDLEVAEALGCSSVVLKPALDRLEKAQIISRGDSRDQPLTLLRHPSKITLEEIKEALYGARVAMHYAKQVARVFSAFEDKESNNSVTLSDVIGISSEKNDNA